MSKRLGLLIVMMLFVTMMTGCFGSDDSSTPTPATTSSVVITGTCPALSAPAGAPNKMINYGTNYEMGVFNAATMTEITGSSVVINGTTYTATVPAGAANVTALVVIRHKTTGKAVFTALAGNLPTATQMVAASVTKVTVSGVNLDGESTALATIAKDKGIAAPSIPVSTSVTSMPATVKSTIDTAVGTATITAIKDAISAVQTVLNASSVPETTKSSILSALDAALANVLNAFVTAVKDASAVITSAGGATTVTVGGTTINSTTTPAQVTDAVNHVTVVTVTAVTDPSDIAVANGTAVSAIQFPTTVTVTLSNGTTASKNVVWSTTSTPAYNATVSGTYAFTGTVDGTTLKATVKVNVGIIQLKVATPTFTPAAGTFTAAQSVTIATATEGATIYYTTDGSEPTTSSSVYSSAINVAATTTIKAIATKTGMTTSDVASALYTINISLIPVISAERAVKQANGDIVVTWTTNIVTPTAAKLIVSGDIPNPSYPSVLETVSTTTSHTVTIPAAKIAENSAYTKLVISYVIGEDGTTASIAKSAIIEAAQVVADPVFAPVAGTYTTAQSVTLTCATEGAEIYYTTDGSTPSSLTTKYTGAIALSTSATTNFKAIAVKTGMTNSNVVSATYVLNISTTKVLTGIALAKATDTVEAETAYTLPTAKASYDDNSVPADVTVSWVEVLAGGTSAVTLPVNKTTAGTYNFQASYTENGVTKTADFVLVVTEKVPVKTLDSITVVATPAAPTCVLGKTAEIALVVTASYINPTTTEVVTTYTTGTNYDKATKVFTPASTAAGTENIVVSYTFDGTTKTFDVPVTITAEAPVVTTVTVSAISLVETAATQAVVLVKDQFGTTMTTGFTLTYAMSNSVASVSASGLVTAAAYNSSATTGTLTVTATPTTGTAKTGTATVTVTADTTKPVITKVEALNNKVIEITYSKKMDDTAIDPTKYSLYHVTNGVMATIVTGNTAAVNEIKMSGLFADTNKTIVRLTILAVHAGTTGYPASGLDSVQYRLYAKDGIKDATTSANTVLANSNVLFTGTTTPDSSAPQLIKVSYNKGTGNVRLTFNKVMTNGLVYSKIKFNGTALTAAGTINNKPDVNILSYDVAAADKTTIAALTGDITVTLLAGAVNDDSTPQITNAEQSMVAELTVPPALVKATYSEELNKLTLEFDQVINLGKSSFLTNSNFQIKSTELPAGIALSSSDTLLTTANGPTIEIQLSSSNINSLENVTTHTSPKVYVKVDSVENSNLTKNLQQDDTTGYPAVALTIVKDTVKPAVSSITYNETTKKLVFNFNVAVQSLTSGSSNIVLKSTETDGQVNTLNTIPGVAVGTTLEFDLSAAGAATTFAGNLKTIQQGKTDADTPNSYDSYFTIAVNTFTKSGSPVLKNDAVSTKAAATTVVYTDNLAPTVDSAVAGTKVSLTVTFNEKVDKASAETVANYSIRNLTTNSPLTVNTATMTDSTTSKKTVVLYTNVQTSGDNYRVDVVNVKDVSNNAITTAVQKTFSGNNNDATLPVVQKITILDVDNSNNLTNGDKFKLEFNEPVQLTGTAPANANAVFEYRANGTFGADELPASYPVAKITVDSTDSKVLYLEYTTSVTWTGIEVVPGTSALRLKAGQTYVAHKYDSTRAASQTVAGHAINPTGDRAAILSAEIEDVNNNAQIDKGDKIYVTFNKQVKLDSGKSWVVAAGAANSSFQVYNTAKDTAYANPFGDANLSITSTITTAVFGNAVTITVGDNSSLTPTLLGGKVYFTFQAANYVVDSWGVKNLAFNSATASTYVELKGKNTISAPQVQSVQFVDLNANGSANQNDYLVYTFNVPVYFNAAANVNTSDIKAAANWKLGSGTLANAAQSVTYFNTSERNKVKVVLDADEAIYAGVTLSDVVAASADFGTNYKLTNFNGAKVTANGSGLVISSATDSTRPAVVSAAFVAAKKIKITFDRQVDVSSTTANKVVLHNGGASAGATGAAISLDPDDTTNVSILVTLSADLESFATTGLGDNNTVNGLGIESGSGIKNAANGLEIVAFGATASSADHKKVAADATAPTNLTDAQLFNLKYDNSTRNVALAAALTPSEKARVEVYIGADTPAKVANTFTAFSVYGDGTAAPFNGANTIITAALGESAAVTHKIFYRLKDVAGNISDWKQYGTVGLPAGTYKKVAALTDNNDATLSTNTLTIKTASGNTTYDISANATLLSIMGVADNGHTFTIDASGKVSAINAATITAGRTITLTAANCATGIDVTSHATNLLTLEGSAPSQATNLTIKGGAVSIAPGTPANLTGTFTVGATAAATVTAGAKDVTVSALIAGTNTLTTTGALTISADLTGALILAAAPSSITANGSATVDGAGNYAIVVADVADAKTLTLSKTHVSTPTITLKKTTSTGKVVVSDGTKYGVITKDDGVTTNGATPTNANLNVTAGAFTVAVVGNDATAADTLTLGACGGALTVNAATGTVPGVVNISGAVGSIASLHTSANVTVLAAGDSTGAIAIPAAYAGTWNSVAKDLTGAITVGGNPAAAGTITLNPADLGFTVTGATHIIAGAVKGNPGQQATNVAATMTGANGTYNGQVSAAGVVALAVGTASTANASGTGVWTLQNQADCSAGGAAMAKITVNISAANALTSVVLGQGL